MPMAEHITTATLLPNSTDSDVFCELNRVAVKIALQNFQWRYITLVVFNSTLLCGIDYFLRTYEKTVIVAKGTFYPSFVGKTRQYVLLGTSVSNLLQTLEWMRDHEFDNTGKYIIVCQSLDLRECEEADAVRAFWFHKITNVIFLKCVENKAIGYTYFPLNDSACSYEVPVKLKSLTTCLDAIDFQEACNMFPIKLKNLNNCTLIASTFIQTPYMQIDDGIPSGSDGDLLLLLAGKINGNLTVMTPRTGSGWGHLEENGTWSGSLADIYYDFANFSMTSAALTLSRFSFFQLSQEYNSASVVWVTHPAIKVPTSLTLVYPLQPSAQLALAMSFVFVMICSAIIRSRFWLKFSRKINTKRPRSSLVFYSWMICMGLPSTKLPSKATFLYIVFFWMWYCFLIRTFYQVTLITALKTNHYYSEFESIDDAIDEDYPLGGGSALKDYYMDYPRVYQKWTDLQAIDIIPTLRNVSQGMKFVLAMNMETAKIIIWKENIHVHILPQKVVTSPTVIFFKKFSPLAESINNVLVRLVECGFAEKLYKTHARSKDAKKFENSSEALKIKHYTGCYGILISGWILSFLLFVFEMLFEKIKLTLSTLCSM